MKSNQLHGSLDDVLITAELARRPQREPDYKAESRALTALAQALASRPEQVLQKLAELAMELCRADSAGISVLEPDGEDGTLWVIHHDREGHFDAEDARLLASLSRFASAAYQMVSAFQLAKAGHQQLERKVEERTHALRDSEQRYRTLFTRMDQGFCIIEKIQTADGEPSDFRYLAVNPLSSGTPDCATPVGKTIRQLVPDAEPSIMERYDRVVQSGEPERFEDYVTALDLWMEAEVFSAETPGQMLSCSATSQSGSALKSRYVKTRSARASS